MDANTPDTALYPPQPTGGVIRLHEAASRRLVLDIPPGKQSGGLGCFAILWNGFMAFFTTVMVLAFGKADKVQEPWIIFLFVGLFWAIGLGLIYAWLKMRYERSFLLIEPDRAVLRKMFLGRQRQIELILDEASKAQLTEAYAQNDVPVYRVTVTGVGGNPIHFGTSLAQNEKDWCVDAVNVLLQPKLLAVSRVTAPEETVCEACGAEIPTDAFRTKDGLVICPGCQHEQATVAVDPLDSAELPDELPGVVTLLEESSERLGLRLAATESAAARWLIGLFTGGFAAVWYSFTGGSMVVKLFAVNARDPVGVFDWVELLFMIPFLIGGLIPLSIALLAFWGRLTTWIDREFVKIRLHVGPFGKTWTMNTPDVTAVRLIDSSEMPSRMGNPRVAGANPRVQGSHQISKAAGICAGTRILSMTGIHQPLTARFVVKKVRAWMNENLPELRL